MVQHPLDLLKHVKLHRLQHADSDAVGEISFIQRDEPFIGDHLFVNFVQRVLCKVGWVCSLFKDDDSFDRRHDASGDSTANGGTEQHFSSVDLLLARILGNMQHGSARIQFNIIIAGI